MNILCIGGGPAGLYFALLMKLQSPAHDITVIERNKPFDTFGWGVVLSDQTLANLAQADPVSAALIGEAFHHWDDIEVFFKGRSVRSGGHGFCGVGRKRLLNILQDRCTALGVNLVFETDVTDDQALALQYRADLVIASDGNFGATAGIDIGSKSEIIRLVRDLAQSGKAVIVISSELSELLTACDRILVMADGRARQMLDRADLDDPAETNPEHALQAAERRLQIEIQKALTAKEASHG